MPQPSENGMEVARILFQEHVRIILAEHMPELDYAAALIGPGSEVLRLDDEISIDHDWGPRLLLFLRRDDLPKYAQKLKILLSNELPHTCAGYSTNWTLPDPEDNGTQTLHSVSSGPINHKIVIYSVNGYLQHLLKIGDIELVDDEWLKLSEQSLLEFTSGEVFHDTFGELTAARQAFSYFPVSVWKRKLLDCWHRISEELAFVGRTGMYGDDLGSRLEATRLVRYCMELAFMLHKHYVPYEKWFAVLFKKLPISKQLLGLMHSTLVTDDWRTREKHLCEIYLILLAKQNELAITTHLKLEPKPYFSRPQQIVDISAIEKVLEESMK